MRPWICAMILALTSLGAQEGPFRKAYPNDGIYWAVNWQRAFEEARLRNVPVHYVIHDDSPASAAMAEVYADKRVIEVSRSYVNLAAHARIGHEVDVEIDGKRAAVCDRFWNLPCSAHASHFKNAANFKEVDRLPVAVVTKAGLEEMGRISGALDAAKTIKALEEQLKKWPGNRLSAGEWREIKPTWDEAEKHFKEGSWRKSIDTFQKLKSRAQDRAKELVKVGWDQVNPVGDRLHGEAFKMSVDPKQREEAKKRLNQIVRDFKPLPCAVKAQDTLDALKKHGF